MTKHKSAEVAEVAEVVEEKSLPEPEGGGDTPRTLRSKEIREWNHKRAEFAQKVVDVRRIRCRKKLPAYDSDEFKVKTPDEWVAWLCETFNEDGTAKA